MPLSLVRRRPGGNWSMRGTVQGVRVYTSTGTSRRAEAEAIAHRREQEIRHRAAHGHAASLTLAEAALSYMQAGGERRFLAPILQHFGPDALLSEINNAAVNAAETAIYPDAAPATVNRQLITPLSAILTMAADDGLAEPRRLRRRKGDQHRWRWLTPEEAEAMIAAATPSFLPTLGILLGTGCRTGEALGIEIDSFHAATGEAWLYRSKSERPRMLRMPQRALEMVLTRPLPKVGPVIRTPSGAPYNLTARGQAGSIKTAFNRCRDAAGLGSEVTPHVLRHTWATWYYAATLDFGGLIDLGGWSSADMANRYRKAAPRDLAQRLLDHGWDFRAVAGGVTEASVGRPIRARV